MEIFFFFQNPLPRARAVRPHRLMPGESSRAPTGQSSSPRRGPPPLPLKVEGSRVGEVAREYHHDDHDGWEWPPAVTAAALEARNRWRRGSWCARGGSRGAGRRGEATRGRGVPWLEALAGGECHGLKLSRAAPRLMLRAEGRDSRSHSGEPLEGKHLAGAEGCRVCWTRPPPRS